MSECPELSAFEGAPTSAVRKHIADCASCRIVVELLDERNRGVEARHTRDECARFELLLAARDEGTIGATAGAMLQAHLRDCSNCQAVAATLSPVDSIESSTLPAVSTAAYALGREVARGGMGRILEARDLRIGRAVAVKELLGKSAALGARFEREARVTARLQHPGIVPIYEIGKWPDGTPFYSMRMVEGQTLRDAIRAKSSLDERLALLPAVIAASEAVAFAHERHVIHRDLTPNNILVGAHGDTVVIDWGLAKDLSDARDDDRDTGGPYRDDLATPASLTTSGAIIGTAAYMPPEQARGKPVDERADVYALGAILYHLLSGSQPYEAKRSADALEQVQAGPPPHLAEVAAGTPRDLASIVEKAMARDASDRYANAGVLAAELRRFQTGRVVEAHHYTRTERTMRWLRQHRVAAIATLVAVTVLAVSGTVATLGIVRERDVAERLRSVAERTNTELLEEHGRRELLDGNPVRAAVWLSAAYTAGDERPSLRFMLASAMHDVESFERTLDCDSQVNLLEASPDKTALLVACDRSVRVWRLSDGALVRTLATAGTLAGFSAHWSHDGNTIVVYGGDGAATLYDVASGARRFELGSATDRIMVAAFSPDDRTLLTGTEQKLKVWNVATGNMMHELAVESSQAVFAGNERLVATSAGAVEVWDVTSGAHLRSINADGLAGGILGTGPSDGQVLVCGAEGVNIWNIETGILVRSFATDASMGCKLAADRRRLLTSGLDATIKLWDSTNGRVLTSINPGVGFDFTLDDERIVGVGWGAGLKVWDASTGTLLGANDAVEPTAPGFVVAGDRVAVAGPSSVAIYRGLGGQQIRTFHAPDGTAVVGATSDGRRAVVQLGDEIKIWDTEHNRSLVHERLHVPFTQNSHWVAARGEKTIAVVDMTTGDSARHIPIDDADALEISDDGRFLLVVRSGRPEVWDTKRSTQVVQWDVGDTASGIATGRDRLMVWRRSGNAVQREVWALDPPRKLRPLGVAGLPERQALFDRTGKTVLVVGGLDDNVGVATLWNIDTGRDLRSVSPVWSARLDATQSLASLSVQDMRRSDLVENFRVEVMRMTDGETMTAFSTVQLLGSVAVSPTGQFATGGVLVRPDVDVWDSTGHTVASLHDSRLRVMPLAAHAAHVAFTADGTELVSNDDRNITTLRFDSERRDAASVARIVRGRAPWTIVEGHLVATDMPTATLRGRITRDGKPAANARVLVQTSYTAPITSVVAAADGTYEIRDLPVGGIDLGGGSETIGAFARFRRVVLVAGNNKADIELDLAGSIGGRVVDSHDRPVAGVVVTARCFGCTETDGEETVTTAEGGFELRPLAGGGTYKLDVYRDREKTHLLEPTADQATVLVKDGSDHVTGVKIQIKTSEH